MTTFDRFQAALNAFDDYNRKDPNMEVFRGEEFPKELLYAQRMTERLAHFAPDADEGVRLAARCQHIGRWEIPRARYPMDKKGYLQWRSDEKKHQANIAEKILSAVGYDQSMIEQVKFLLLKKELFSNPATQLLEDVVCLVFIEFYLEEFVSKHEEEKVIDILRKTVKKMTPMSRTAMGSLKLTDKVRTLISRSTGSAV